MVARGARILWWGRVPFSSFVTASKPRRHNSQTITLWIGQHKCNFIRSEVLDVRADPFMRRTGRVYWIKCSKWTEIHSIKEKKKIHPHRISPSFITYSIFHLTLQGTGFLLSHLSCSPYVGAFIHANFPFIFPAPLLHLHHSLHPATTFE